MSRITPDVSVVLDTDTENPNHRLRFFDAVRGLKTQTRADRIAELLVVATRPPTAAEQESLRGLPARWIEVAGGGRYYALKNRGIQESQSTYVVLTDSDTRPDPDWLEKALAALEAGGPQVALVTGRFRSLPGPFSRELALAVWPHLAEEPYDSRWILASNVIARGETLRGFRFDEEHARHGADNLLAARLIEAGYRVRYDPSLTILHNYAKRTRDLLPYCDALGWRYAQIDGFWGSVSGSALANAVGRFRVLAQRLREKRRVFGISAARLPVSLFFYVFFCLATARGYARALRKEPEPGSPF